MRDPGGQTFGHAFLFSWTRESVRRPTKTPAKTTDALKFWGADGTDRIWKLNRRMSAVPVTRAMAFGSSLFTFFGFPAFA